MYNAQGNRQGNVFSLYVQVFLDSDCDESEWHLDKEIITAGLDASRDRYQLFTNFKP